MLTQPDRVKLGILRPLLLDEEAFFDNVIPVNDNFLGDCQLSLNNTCTN